MYFLNNCFVVVTIPFAMTKIEQGKKLCSCDRLEWKVMVNNLAVTNEMEFITQFSFFARINSCKKCVQRKHKKPDS